jgi:hypothetical protein
MGKYKYRNEADYTFHVPELSQVLIAEDYFLCVRGKITIKKDYCWNGCTFAPDHKKTYIASMVHDSLYQYGKKIGLKRKVADRWFYYYLQKNMFIFAWVYYASVRIFWRGFY